MTVRGGGVPKVLMASNAVSENGSAASELSLPMRITASWFGLWPTEYKDVARIFVAPHAELPSTRHPDHSQSAFVLGAVKDFAGGANAPSLTAPARDGLTRPMGRDEETGLSRSNKR